MTARTAILAALVACLCPTVAPADSAAAARGREALLTRAFNGAVWSADAYHQAGHRWPGGLRTDAYDVAFMKRYGLHPAPYANDGYPMGLRRAPTLFGSGLTTDCMLCHGGSIAGQSYIGLGNSSLDMQGLYEDMAAADGRPPETPFTFTRVRGTTEAAAMAVFLISYRDSDLAVRTPPLDLGLRDDLCEDPPAWWLLKKKRTMYLTGSGDARSVRSLMQFMMSPLNTPAMIKREEPTFADIREYLLTLEPPKCPFGIDRDLVSRGETLFRARCASCHGTYGEAWTYPNRVVPLEVIGTDPARCEGLSEAAGEHYNSTWFARERAGWLTDDYAARKTVGYQAPPLDGIWATAPYFHNGSVPTVYGVLNSRARPERFTRSYGTDAAAYDTRALGWRFRELRDGEEAPEAGPRGVYDTRKPGRGNGGHTFGDDLSDDERFALIEYLKTL